MSSVLGNSALGNSALGNSVLKQISEITPDSNSIIELEARFFIDERKTSTQQNVTSYSKANTIAIAKSLINKYKPNNKKISQTINFVDSDNNVKNLVFINGEQKKQMISHYKKTRKIGPIFLMNNTPCANVTVNLETNINEWSVSKAVLARIRLRLSIVIDRWQLDITLVKSITNLANASQLKDAKNVMLVDNLTISNFEQIAPFDFADVIEFELEFDSKLINTLTLNDFAQIHEIFSDIKEVSRVLAVTDTSHSSDLQEYIYKIAKIINPANAHKFKKSLGLKSLSNQVIEIDKNTFIRDVYENITNFYITDKIDGKRAIIFINENTAWAVSDKVTQLKVNTDLINSNTYVFDSEEYSDGNYYIFDILMYANTLLVNKPFETRLSYLSKATELSPVFKSKPFIKLTDDFKNQITKFKARFKQLPYETDGIILTPSNELYFDMKVYKYKPIDQLSVDFLIKKCPNKLLNITPYTSLPGKTLYLLFCGIKPSVLKKLKMNFIKHYNEIFPHIDTKNLPNYIPIQFQPSDKVFSYLYYIDDNGLSSVKHLKEALPSITNNKYSTSLDNLVGEFVYDMKGCKWVLHKIRTDRTSDVARGNYFGNNYKIAELIWNSYKDPLIIEELATITNYFVKNDNPIQKASRNFHSYVKNKILSMIENKSVIMDLASGKGQDLFRYGKFPDIQSVTFLEIDQVAIMELINRKHAYAQEYSNESMQITTHKLDLNDKYTTNIEILSNDLHTQENSIDLIVCNFAFHYLIKDKPSLQNILKFVSYYLKSGGKFAFTTFDGKSIIKLLNDNLANWTVYGHNTKSAQPTQSAPRTIKYSIKKQYTTNKLDDISQKIDVLLPFSSEEYYSEYLVNIEYITKIASQLKLKLIENQSFGKLLPMYEKENSNGFNELDDDDKIYSSLYHYYIFEKK